MKKQLQKNYTNPEQSKRLLELGLPVRSADCFSRPDGTEIGIYQPRTHCRIDEFIAYANKRYGRTYYIPVWSLGRLIEIMSVCGDIIGQRKLDLTRVSQYYNDSVNVIELAVEDIEKLVNSDGIDFSKLKELEE